MNHPPTRPHDPAFLASGLRGLTKREYLAALCLGGILSQQDRWESLKAAAEVAVWAADHLIEELNREGNHP